MYNSALTYFQSNAFISTIILYKIKKMDVLKFVKFIIYRKFSLTS